MERNLEFLTECMDDLSMEQQKVSFLALMEFVVCVGDPVSFKLVTFLSVYVFAVPILLSKPFPSTSSTASMASKKKVILLLFGASNLQPNERDITSHIEYGQWLLLFIALLSFYFERSPCLALKVLRKIFDRIWPRSLGIMALAR